MKNGPKNHSLLVVAHPGHELLVHGWLEKSSAEVMILTDGSGSHSPSRIDSSVRTIAAAGGRLSSAWRPVTDRAVYEALLCRDADFFLRRLDQLTNCILDNRPASVVGDASEGYNPTHDLCRALIDRAVARARSMGVAVLNYAFPLIYPHVLTAEGPDSMVLYLDQAVLSRKISAAKRYPELADELEAVLSNRVTVALAGSPRLERLADARIERMEPRNLQLECLTNADRPSLDELEEVPFYELYGEHMVKLGRYREVIRYDRHVLPILETLDAESR